MPLPVRLLVGLVKGLLVGGLFGFALAAAGAVVPGAWLAYPMAAIVGALVALVAGKPIWAEGARIEVGAKAVAGLILGPILMALSRNFLAIGFDPSMIPGVGAAAGATLGTTAVTSLAMVGALLAGFYDADNSPAATDDGAAEAGARIGGTARIDASEAADELSDYEAADVEARNQRRP